jgi:hypothetical protein
MPLSLQQVITPLIRSTKWSVRFWLTQSRIIYCRVRIETKGVFVPKHDFDWLTTLFHVQFPKTGQLSGSNTDSIRLIGQLSLWIWFPLTPPSHSTYQAVTHTAHGYLESSFPIGSWGLQFQNPYFQCDFGAPRYALLACIDPHCSILRDPRVRKYDWGIPSFAPLPSACSEARQSSHFLTGPGLYRLGTLV